MGERGILVCELLQRLGDKGLARHFAHGGKHERIDDAARLEVARDHDGAVACVRIAFQGPGI
jgi:hypothetical protein